MIKGFILTMWYINKGFSLVINSAGSRFILTMWYINSRDSIDVAI